MPFYVSCMASIPQVYSSNAFPADPFFEFQNPPVTKSLAGAPSIEGAMWDRDQFVQLLDNYALDHIAPSNSNMPMASSGWTHTSPDQLDWVDHNYGMQMQTSPEPFGNGNACEMLAWTNNGEVYLETLDGLHQQGLNQFAAECFAFVEDLEAPAIPMPDGENWGIQYNQLQAVEQTNMKPLKYSGEERRERIQRYMKKRGKRNFNRTIKYECRKTIADKRVRVRGRFAKKNESYPQEELATKHDNAPNIDLELAGSQLKADKGDWLEEAMASLA